MRLSNSTGFPDRYGDHTGARLAQPDSTVKRPERQVAGHASAHGPADDAPGVEVEHDGQVQPALCRPDIADVGSPFLVGCLGGEVLVEQGSMRRP